MLLVATCQVSLVQFLNAVLLALLESPAPATGGPYGLALTGVSEPTDTMAAQAATSRQSYPQRESSYQTPQSNSPASGRRSPQTDAHGRPVHGMPPMAQQMYYPQYQIPQQSSYAQRPPTSQHTSMTSAPGKMMPHQQAQQPPTHQPPQHQPPSMIDMKAQPPSSQRPPSVVGGPQSAPSTSSRPSKLATGPSDAPLLTRLQLLAQYQRLHRSFCAKIKTACS